jgi:DNA-binding beta-propeller fold protein YncE
VWVSAEIGGTLSIIDAKTFEILKVIGFEIPGVPVDPADGNRFQQGWEAAFLALGPANRVAVIDTRAMR